MSKDIISYHSGRMNGGRVLTIDTSAFKRLGVELNGIYKEIPKAAASAMNRTLDYTATQTGRVVHDEYLITVGDVKKTLSKHRANPASLSASIDSVGRRLTMYHHFRVTPKTRPDKRRKYTVKVQVKRTGGKKPMLGNPPPFVPSKTAAKKNQQLFQRTTSKRKPVKVILSLSVPQMIGSKPHEKIMQLANKKLEERIEHEINFRIDRAAKKMQEGLK